jgi:prolyl oligopeptidase
MKAIPAPPSTRISDMVEELHGHRISDPYRWLEDAGNPETAEWVERQNEYTRSFLDRVPQRKEVQRRLTELLEIGVVGTPVGRGNRYFYTRREGRQNQSVLYLREGRDGEERVLLDPNSESAEGLVTLDWWYPSWDGSLLAYGYSANGDEWSTLHILVVDSGNVLPDRIERTRYSSVAWLPDNTGFYYTRYPLPGEVPEGDENYNTRIFLHLLGSQRAGDPEVFVRDTEKEELVHVQTSKNGRWLIAGIHKGWERNDLYIRDLATSQTSFLPIVEGLDALFDVDIVDDTLYIHTNLGAPRFRVFRTDAARPQQEHWREIISESDDAVLTSITPAGDKLAAGYLHNAASRLVIFDSDGKRLSDVDLPGLGTVTAVSGQWTCPEVFYGFESFITPPTVFRLSLDTGTSDVWASVEADLNPDDFTVRQEWYRSRDGTDISIFLVHRKDLDRSAPQPTVLTGYGGFNVGRTPLFDRTFYLWVERGGVYALPNLRGGNEYGEDWHRAGMLDRKQNVFDDFIGAAEHLIARGYTESSKLAISGRSNGGLLVGAVMTQRPELFRAVVCGVPLLDMLRYHRFLIARLWIPEYGSAENPDQFPYLYAYSPYHHVKPGAQYPAVLLFTAESDSRVEPLHARKMAALLQAANASEHPILLRVETQAGHGIGKPIAKVLEEQVDVLSFVSWQLCAS